MKKKDLKPRNSKGQPHGYWERYYDNGQLCFKGNYVNGEKHGYWEMYHPNGKLHLKGNFFNDKQHGYWEWYWVDGDVRYKGYYDMGERVDYVVEVENVINNASELFPIF